MDGELKNKINELKENNIEYCKVSEIVIDIYAYELCKILKILRDLKIDELFSIKANLKRKIESDSLIDKLFSFLANFTLTAIMTLTTGIIAGYISANIDKQKELKINGLLTTGGIIYLILILVYLFLGPFNIFRSKYDNRREKLMLSVDYAIELQKEKLKNSKNSNLNTENYKKEINSKRKLRRKKAPVRNTSAEK